MRARIARLFVTPLPLALMAVGLLVFAGGTMAAVRLTEAPSFCRSCHEMDPYHAAWAQGPHKDVSCISCHVDPGLKAEVSHKVVALKEVYDHFAGDPRFPRGDAEVPDARCLACHTDLPAVTRSGFQHKLHAAKGTCRSCHADTGHSVSLESLKSAGILALQPVQLQTASASTETTASRHVKVSCTSCHDLATTPCATCHKTKHEPRGACESCHQPGPAWAFAHPASTSCTDCHKAPAKHFGNDCARCHDPRTPFARTAFKHDAAATQCASCHPAPANHFPGACNSCHTPSTPFAKTKYDHRSSACADCHTPPRGHFRGTCADCHRPSVAFSATKFSHGSDPGSCSSCHRKNQSRAEKGSSSIRSFCSLASIRARTALLLPARELAGVELFQRI
jgi:nitrate/TMAO reductase-like tetraheme cytochrome c subunit